MVQADDERDLFPCARRHPDRYFESECSGSQCVPLPDALQQSCEILRTVPEGASGRLQQDGTALLEGPERTGMVPVRRRIELGREEGPAASGETRPWFVENP